MTEQLTDLAIVFLVGAVVGVGELVARYRDNPTRAIRTVPAGTYIAINGLASVLALVAIFTFGWTADANQTQEAQRMLRILAAGFGAMALFRTSLFVVRVGTTDIGVGPVAFLQILLAATDRGVDRKRASDRAEKVVRIMKDLDFDTAFNALPPFAIMLMQNLSLEDKTAIGDQAKAVGEAASGAPNETRILNLGLMLMNFVGEEVLEDAVRGVKGQSKPPGPFARRAAGSGSTSNGPDGSGASGAGAGSGAAASGAATGGARSDMLETSTGATRGPAATGGAGDPARGSAVSGGGAGRTGGGASEIRLGAAATAGGGAGTVAEPIESGVTGAASTALPATTDGAGADDSTPGTVAVTAPVSDSSGPPPGTMAAGTPLPRPEDEGLPPA